MACLSMTQNKEATNMLILDITGRSPLSEDDKIWG